MNRFLTRKRNIGFLVLAVMCLSFFSWFVISVPPDTIFSHVVFYVLLFCFSFALFQFIFAAVKVSYICSGGIVMYFFLRFLHLRHPLYAILLFMCCLAVLRLTSPRERKRTN